MNIKPVRVCLYGGPGVGKSSLAARLYADLKSSGVQNVELVQEYIKYWAYANTPPQDVYDQYYVFAKQLRREHKLLKKGVSVITDSPLRMQVPYAQNAFGELAKGVHEIASTFEAEYKTVNLLIQRSHDYQTAGRFEDFAAARKMDVLIKRYLDDNKVPYTLLDKVNDYSVFYKLVQSIFCTPAPYTEESFANA